LIKATHSGKAGSSMNPGIPGSFPHPLCLTHGKSEASQHTCPSPQKKHQFHRIRKVTDRRTKSSSIYKRSGIICFLAVLRILRLCQVLFSSSLFSKFLFCAEPVKGNINSSAHEPALRCPLRNPTKIGRFVYELR
jgi:hypothetical protein